MILVSMAGFILGGCTPGASYERKLKKELASGVRYDSLFMGIYLGMSDKDFYTHCWELNRQGVIKQGSKNMSVEHGLKAELNHPATMNFYPEFIQGKIAEMPVQFIYNGWAPWNKGLSSDSLLLDVVRWYEQVYGNGFIVVEHPQRGKAYVKINGNRRITLFKKDDMYVWAIFRDMLVEEGAGDTTNNAGVIKDDFGAKIEN